MIKISVGVRDSPLRAISTARQMTQESRSEGTSHMHQIRDKGTGFSHKGHCLLRQLMEHRYPQHSADALTNAQHMQQLAHNSLTNCLASKEIVNRYIHLCIKEGMYVRNYRQKSPSAIHSY